MQTSSGQVPSKFCSWCDVSSSTHPLPLAFCWTKMQAEAGHTIDTIIHRKELERAIGGGIFYWGIGNALGTTVLELLRRTSRPEVLFSLMRAKPKREDVFPESLLLWTEYMDSEGFLQPLPLHTLTLSRGNTAMGVKRRHYALVCYSNETLAPSSLASLNLSHFRNVGGSRGKIGFSQVTAIIEHSANKQDGARYEVSLRTMLKPPYFITLAGPKRVLEKDRESINAMIATDPTPGEWKAFVNDLRNRPEYGCQTSKSSLSLGDQ